MSKFKQANDHEELSQDSDGKLEEKQVSKIGFDKNTKVNPVLKIHR